MSTGQSAAPKGKGVRFYTPPALAALIVTHFKPAGSILEPCRGKGAFTDAFEDYQKYTGRLTTIDSCEIDDGTDFFDCNRHFNWIITNPPWGGPLFNGFVSHSMQLADDIVLLVCANVWMTKSRLRTVSESGFGIREMLKLRTPDSPWPQSGFQLVATHLQRAYTGPLHLT